MGAVSSLTMTPQYTSDNNYLRRVTCAGPYIPVHTTNYQVSGRVRRNHRPAHAVADISCTHPDTPGHAKFHGTCTDNFGQLQTPATLPLKCRKLQCRYVTSDNFRHLPPYPTSVGSYNTCHPTPQVSEVTVTSRNFRQLRTTSDTCHPTPQVSEVTVTSRNFRQLRTTSDTCHPTPQVSEVTVTSRNFRQLRTTSDTCHPTPQVSEVTVTSDFTPDNPQNHSEMVVTSDNFRQLLPP
ncbi:hypothetical protein Bbelb_064800 [Branchiostoma belcheri]|nr:hypothetical protein Bbelb_064800 [Branchiostoma belcheri]